MPCNDVWKFLSFITVEPAILLYEIPTSVQNPAESDFIYRRLCIQRYNDSEICENLHNVNYSEQEKIVQGDAAIWLMYGNLCKSLFPLLVMFMYGALSDSYSRRLVISIPIIGVNLESLVFLIMSLFPTIPVQVFMIARIFVGVTGSWPTFYMAVFSYVAAITNENHRTVRMGIAQGTFAIGLSIGFFISGVILDNTSFTFVFALMLGLQTLGIIYIFVYMRNPENRVDSQQYCGSTQTHSEATAEMRLRC